MKKNTKICGLSKTSPNGQNAVTMPLQLPLQLYSWSKTVVGTLVHEFLLLGVINKFCVICFGHCQKNTYRKNEKPQQEFHTKP